MKNYITAIVCFVIGTFFTIYYKMFAIFVINQQNKFYKFNFGAREVKITEVITLIIGISLIIIAILTFFNVIRFK